MTLRSRLLAGGVALAVVLGSTSCASLEWASVGSAPPEPTEHVLTQETGPAHPWSPTEDPIQWMHARASAGAKWLDPPGTTTPWPENLTPEHGEPLTVDMASISWTIIDGGTDNAVSGGFERGAPWGYLYLGLTVRSAGWAQLSEADRAASGPVTVTMSPAQWAFAVHTVDRGLPYYTGDERKQLEDARAVVTTSAAAHGVDLEPPVTQLTSLRTTARSVPDAWDEALMASFEAEQGW